MRAQGNTAQHGTPISHGQSRRAPIQNLAHPELLTSYEWNKLAQRTQREKNYHKTKAERDKAKTNLKQATLSKAKTGSIATKEGLKQIDKVHNRRKPVNSTTASSARRAKRSKRKTKLNKHRF